MQEEIIYFFQNYIWVPIISAIIGGILSLGSPAIIKRIVELFKNKINKNIEEINISGIWHSFFHEEEILQTEDLELKQIGRNVIGTISLDGEKYDFIGEFKNHILSGTYKSISTSKYEYGSITVRRINENLMSGYCTFVFDNKQVYNSPYVLSSDSKHKVKNGTYAFCNTCVGKFDCCCNCNEIDMPILLPKEVENIEAISRISVDEFANKLTQNLFQMKRANNDDSTKGCVFFQNNGCSIYENRPIDCRLFPFDFKEIDGEYWLIYYDNVAVCKALPKDRKEISHCAHNIRPLLDLVLPYMSECSDPVFCKRLDKQSYKKLFPINKIRDDIYN